MTLLHMLMQTDVASAVELAKAQGAGWGAMGAGIGMGLTIVGAGIGLGRIGGQVAEAIARQPEKETSIRGSGIFFGVLLEGTVIISLVFALLFKFV